MVRVRNFMRGKGFAAVCIVLAALSVTCFSMQVSMWGKYLFPEYPVSTNNNISGLNYFAYFTVLTNALCALWLLVYGISKFTYPKLAELISKPMILAPFTVCIFVVGFLYWGVMIWFIDFYPAHLWMFNVIDVYEHFVIPFTFLFTFFVGLGDDAIYRGDAKLYLIYPLCYFVFSIIRGNIIDWYAYPFFSAKELWKTLFDTPFRSTEGWLLLVAIIIFLLVFFYALGRAAIAINNRRVGKLKPISEK